jgi:hypothetical protein
LRALLKKGDREHVPLDLNSVVDEVAQLVTNDVVIRNVRMSLDLATDLPKVVGDRVQLRQVILNLVLNGLEAMRETNDRDPALVIRTSRAGDTSVTVTIEDSGPGIEAHDVERLFGSTARAADSESPTLLLGKPVEAGVVENAVQPRVERMARRDFLAHAAMEYQRVIVPVGNQLQRVHQPLGEFRLTDAAQIKLSHIGRIAEQLRFLPHVVRRIRSEGYVVIPRAHFTEEADFPLFVRLSRSPKLYDRPGADVLFEPAISGRLMECSAALVKSRLHATARPSRVLYPPRSLKIGTVQN